MTAAEVTASKRRPNPPTEEPTACIVKRLGFRSRGGELPCARPSLQARGTDEERVAHERARASIEIGR